MILQHDNTCRQLLLSLRDWLQGAGPLWLKLYSNRPTLRPDVITPGQFVEAAFSGYAAINVNGSIADPFRLAPGQWKADVGPARYAHNGGPTVGNVNGCFLQRGTDVCFAAEFLAPVLMQAGSLPLVLFLRLTQEAKLVVSALH